MMRQTVLWVVAAILGGISGWLGIHTLAFLTWGNALGWLFVTVVLGQRPGTRSSKAVRLGTYGFVTGFSFMCFGYAGDRPLVTRLIPFAAIGLLCAAAATVAGIVSHLIVAKIQRSTSRRNRS